MVNLVICLHHHQPVGNFPSIFEEAFQKAYYPLIKTLASHPEIKVALHYSGVLLEWILKEHPSFKELIKMMLERKQIELMTGGFYEPILPIIPQMDRIGQIKMLSEFLEREFGTVPKGLWLTERVWEPSLPKTLVRAGAEYTVVDDTHFLIAGHQKDDLFQYFLTEEEGFPLKLFIGSKFLRYSIPFKPPEETVRYLREVATPSGERVVVLADDGEKFGLWPGTYQWVYQQGWLENFLLLLKSTPEIKILTFEEYLNNYPPKGLSYLPISSYEEMNEWSGGSFRNFLIKYPESNNLHKKMILISQRLESLSEEKKRGKDCQKAKRELYQGQCGCGYWHGIFGGLYLNHLRFAILEHLLKAERIIDKIIHQKKGWLELNELDFDHDGKKELLLSNPYLNLYLRPSAGGSIFEEDDKLKFFNYLNTLTRRREAYHKKLAELSLETPSLSEVTTIHHVLRAKEDGLRDLLHYDRYQRVSLIDHFLKKETQREDFFNCVYEEEGDFINRPYDFSIERRKGSIRVRLERKGHLLTKEERLPLMIKKEVLVRRNSSAIEILYQLKNIAERDLELWFGVEFNLSFSHHPHLSEKISGLNLIKIKDERLKLGTTFSFDQPTDLWSSPIETVSLSESGFERNYQETAIFFHWRIFLKHSELWKVKIKQELT